MPSHSVEIGAKVASIDVKWLKGLQRYEKDRKHNSQLVNLGYKCIFFQNNNVYVFYMKK